jgi:hypothetical protein
MSINGTSLLSVSCGQPCKHTGALRPDRLPFLLPQMTVDTAKFKLSSHCGTPAGDMVLQLKNGAGALVATLLEGQRKLGYFSPQDGYMRTLHAACIPCHGLSGKMRNTACPQHLCSSACHACDLGRVRPSCLTGGDVACTAPGGCCTSWTPTPIPCQHAAGWRTLQKSKSTSCRMPSMMRARTPTASTRRPR